MRASVALIAAINTQITALGKQVEAHFGRHPDAEIYRSQPGLGDLLGARVLGEFGDDPDRYAGARARKNYAGSAPVTRASAPSASSSPATCATGGWPMPCTSRPSAR